MTTITAHQALTIFVWFLLVVLIGFMLLIARFYQNVSRQKTYFWTFAAPIILFGLASARYAFINQISGDMLGDAFWFTGGVSLIGLCWWLYRQMTRGK